MEEEADYVSFMLDGRRVSGWLWRSPFRDGDVVEVAAEWRLDQHECFAIARPSDRTIALYPHCTRTIRPHILNAIKWWIYASLFFELVLLAIASTMDPMTTKQVYTRTFSAGGGWVLAGIHGFMAVAAYSMTRNWIPFTHIAENGFVLLELPNASKIDLVKSSRGKHQPNDTFEFGAMYFRY